MRRIILSFAGGVALLLAAAATAGAVTTRCDFTQYTGSQDSSYKISNLQVSGPIVLVWSPKNKAHGLSPHADADEACNVASELGVNAAFMWGEQQQDVPQNDTTTGVAPKGHPGVRWISSGWTHTTSGSRKSRKIHWRFHQKGHAATVTFLMTCTYKNCAEAPSGAKGSGSSY